MAENTLIIRDKDGGEVSRVPVQSADPRLADAVAGQIRASLREGYYLDYPEGDYGEEIRRFFARDGRSDK